MKKIVFAGMLAVSVMAIGQERASAWVNTRFGVGLNWDLQSGGNNLLWGAWKNGQPPGPEAFGGGGGHGYGQPSFGGPMPAPFGAGQMQQGFPAQGFSPMPQGVPQSPFDASMAQPQPFASQYNSSPYQFATYPRPVYYYTPSYYGR